MTELEWMDVFRDNLIDLMKEANMSQQDLVEATGIAKGTISKYLAADVNKRQVPGIISILKIADALDCDVSELVDYRDLM